MLTVVLTVALAACGGGRQQVRDFTPIEAALREGDIVFRRGTGMVSHAVMAADRGGAYSHTGIVVLDGGALKIVHVVPGEPDASGVKDRIKAEEPKIFFAPDRAVEGAVMRLQDEAGAADSIAAGSGNSIAARAARRALALVEKEIAFDHDYDLEDTTRMYCTELLQFVFEREGCDITDGARSHIAAPGFRGDYILPTDIQNSPRVRPIYRF
ncbi:MAG: hypothetical protein LBU97_05560 [Alistipes sp.]|nr:hypothetical protein [Alistipes sp.]